MRAGESLGEVGLPAARRAEQQDVRLLQFDVVAATDGAATLVLVLDPPVVVVHRNRQDLLGVVLAHHVVVEEGTHLTGIREVLEADLGRIGQLLLDDLVTEIDALVADVDAGTGNQLLHLLL